jgi:hypothetical protein
VRGLVLDALDERDDDARRPVGIGDVEVALGGALPEDPLQDRRHPAGDELPELLPQDRVPVGQPRLEERQREVSARVLVLRGRREDALEALDRGQARPGHDRVPAALDAVGHALDDRFEEVALRAEVVVERPLRGTGRVEDILDAESLAAAGLDQRLGGVNEGVPTDGMGDWVERPGHDLVPMRRRSDSDD